MSANRSRSLRALDWLNFFMADVVTGIGPFLAIYLTASRHWDPARVGLVVGTQSVASVLAQGPSGWLVDYSETRSGLSSAPLSLSRLAAWPSFGRRPFLARSSHKLR